MEVNKKTTFNQLWEMRHLTVEECLNAIKQNPSLQFLLTGAGIWFFISYFAGLFIAANVVYFVYRVFRLVLF